MHLRHEPATTRRSTLSVKTPAGTFKAENGRSIVRRTDGRFLRPVHRRARHRDWRSCWGSRRHEPGTSLVVPELTLVIDRVADRFKGRAPAGDYVRLVCGYVDGHAPCMASWRIKVNSQGKWGYSPAFEVQGWQQMYLSWKNGVGDHVGVEARGPFVGATIGSAVVRGATRPNAPATVLLPPRRLGRSGCNCDKDGQQPGPVPGEVPQRERQTGQGSGRRSHHVRRFIRCEFDRPGCDGNRGCGIQHGHGHLRCRDVHGHGRGHQRRRAGPRAHAGGQRGWSPSKSSSAIPRSRLASRSPSGAC